MALPEPTRLGLIADLARLLRELGFEPTSLDLADLIWLAGYLDAPLEISQPAELVDKAKLPELLPPTEKREDVKFTSQPKIEAVPRHSEQRAGLYISEYSGLSIATPGGTALPGKLAIGRALRPLMRYVQSLNCVELDEEATVQRIADKGNWLPIQRPTLERWLELDLVADEWSSMAVWQPVVIELVHFLEQHGAFRSVRSWGLEIAEPDHQLRLHAGLQAEVHSWRNPKELVEARGNRLILVLSDCLSPAWYEGQMGRLMAQWGKSQMVTLVQMLPERLWPRSGLSNAMPLRLRSHAPGTPNQCLEQHLPWNWQGEAPQMGFPIPVITLEPEIMAIWSDLIAGKERLWMPGFLLPLNDAIEKQRQAEAGPAPEFTPEERLNLFRSLASPQAYKLATYLAAAPLSLPVMRLVQRVMLPESRQIHLAEFFSSGLIQREKDEETSYGSSTNYDFVPGVRKLLIHDTPVSDTLEVLRNISVFVDRHTGKPIDFRSILATPEVLQNAQDGSSVKIFGSIAIDVLHELGGEYRLLAEQIEKSIKPISNQKNLRSKVNAVTSKQTNLKSIETTQPATISESPSLVGSSPIDIRNNKAGVYVITITGASGAGKSSTLFYLLNERDKYFNPVMIPKYTDRPSHRDDRGEVICVDKIPASCDLRYIQYGASYGIELNWILEQIKTNKCPIVILNDIRAVEDIRTVFGGIVKSLFVFRQGPTIIRYKEIAEIKGLSQYEMDQRILKAQTLFRIYIENILTFDHVIINNSTLTNLRLQVKQVVKGLQPHQNWPLVKRMRK